MRLRVEIIVAAVMTIGCGQSEQPSLPQPVPLTTTGPVDAGFPIKSRPGCAPEVVAAAHDLSKIEPLVRRGVVFTCGSGSEPLLLDEAVFKDDVDAVRALLAAHADPNARWSSHGDRFPLQGAIEAQTFGLPRAHRMQIIRLLLQHGADPNARWCFFESRGPLGDTPSCNSPGGVTPLIVAAAMDDAELAESLLDAGADYTLHDWTNATALDVAHSEKMLYLLLGVAFPEPKGRAAHALIYLTERVPRFTPPRPWQQTALARAIVGDLAATPFSPPPPSSPNPRGPTKRDGHHSFGADRTRVLLVLGADPNEQLRGTADWSPLALAIGVDGVDLVEMLVGYGADVNARWCAPVDFSRDAHVVRPSGCAVDNGTTPLMSAAMRGDGDIVSSLVSRGADRTLTDWRGRTAQWYAREAGFSRLAATLR
jgi:ankyrin repeat protein